MGLKELLVEYANVRNGQDLINAGVIPKTSSEMMTLIAYNRLKALKDSISSNLDEALIGTWIKASEKQGNIYVLRNGINADDKLGHKIKIPETYTGRNWDNQGGETNAEIPAGSIGNLKACEKSSQNSAKYAVTISFDQKIAGRNIYRFRLDDLADNLQASSRGQHLPQDKEQLIFEQTLYEFFDKARNDTERTERLIDAMLMTEKDIILIGPPGAGKSVNERDIVGMIMKHQGIRFEVAGCRIGCNPYSLFDEEFAKKVHPCSDCMEKYNGDKRISYKETGIFIPPRPKDVPVKVAAFGPGHGATFIESTEETRRRHLIGQKIPKLDKTTDAEREDQRSMEGFSAGAISKSHNGICHIEEIDKLRPQSLASLLEVNSNHRVQPDDVDFELPCRNIIIATANDPSALTDYIKDRFFVLAMRYHEDKKAAQKMIKTAYHNIKSKHRDIEIPNLHIEDPHILRQIVMPITLENGITSFYYKFRNEYQGEGKSEFIESNRSIIDALDLARSKLLKRQLFFKNTPRIADTEYAITGIQYALCARIATGSRAEDKKVKEALREWTRNNYPIVQTEEENVWCCEFFNTHLSVLAEQAPEIKDNFFREMDGYLQDARSGIKTYQAVRRAHDNPGNADAQMAVIDNPFMEYLFLDQPGMETIKQDALVELIDYFSKTYQNSPCKITDKS